MELSPSSEADSDLASQEISRLLWKPNVHYRVHKIRQFQRPVQNFITSFFFFSR